MDKPWFVRQSGRGHYQVKPYAWQGWAVTAAFVVVISAISGVLALSGVPEFDRWIAFGVLATVALGTFVLVAVRQSVPIESLGDTHDR